jgi:hypothetical protein
MYDSLSLLCIQDDTVSHSYKHIDFDNSQTMNEFRDTQIFFPSLNASVPLSQGYSDSQLRL